MVRYSERALFNRFKKESWIELCNNDCGRLVYYDVETNSVRNATGTDEDLEHKDSCDFIKDLKKAARSFNWYPNLAIDPELDVLFEAIDSAEFSHNYGQLLSSCRTLQDTITTQRMKNKQTKQEWDAEKAEKLEWKKHSPQAKDREREQLSQWNALKETPPGFVRGDKL